MKYYRFIFILFRFYLVFIALKTNSQNLQRCRKESYYTYIYALDNNTAKEIYCENDWLKESHLTNLVDSFITKDNYKKKLPIGHYVYLNTQLNALNYELKSVNSLDAYLFNSKKYILIYPFDKTTFKPITNATVELNGRKARFDREAGVYKLRKRKEGYVTISSANEQAFFHFEKERGEYSYQGIRDRMRMFKYNLRRQMYYRTSDRNLNKGYVVFNKPKYLPNDTVKFKALILTKKKKYFKGAVTVKLESVCNENEKRILKILKPESPGAYVYQFALGDTLTLNKRYSIILYDTKSNKLLIESESFELKDYQLNEAKYRARTDKDLYSKGEPIVIYASGKDANGFNILDGRVDIKATIKSVDKYIADKVFIPNLFWSANEKLDPLGETKLNIPDSLFPSVDFDLKIDLTFNNSNNETHDTTFTIRYMETGEKLEVKLDSGYVTADYLLNGKSTPVKCKIIKRVAFQDITDSIQLPYKERINSNVHQYKFFVKNFSEEALNYRDEYLTNVYGFRTKDSVFINTNNPCNLDIAYSIYKDQKEIEKGIAKTVHKVLQDKSNANYYVYYNYIWQAETYSFTKSIQLYDKTLNININQPKQVYPGQKTQVKINVTGYEDEPVENVNVTAYAINSQFKHVDLPEIPYLGKFHYKNFRTRNYVFEGKIHDAGSLPFNEKWHQKFGTDTMPYYNLLYPKNGMHYNFDSVKTINTQVSPFLVDKGNQVPICIVYIDNLPVYYCNTSNSENYVFISSPGHHQIRLRTVDKEYHLDSVLLKKGLKLDFSVDVNQLPKNCFEVPIGNTLSLEEKRNIRNTIVSIFDDTEGLNYLWQNNHFVAFNESGNRYRYSQLNNFGGFFPGKINYTLQNKLVQTFTFEPGYDYTIRDGVIKMVSNDFLKSQITLRPNENCYHQMGLKALPISSIKLKNSANWHLNFITPNPKINQVGKGTFKVEYTGDSTICLIQLIKYGNDSTVKYFDLNYNSTVYDIEPGYYRLTFITPSKHYFKKDSIHILPDGTSFERFNDLATTQSLSIYNIQTCKKDSVVSKWHSPEEISMFNSYSYVSSDGPGAIKVSLRDNETKEAIPFANVVAYRNGIQVSVATTNIDGEALIKPLNPGRYSVKAFYVGYQTREVTSIPVNNGVAYVTIELTSGGKLDEVQCVSYQMPLIDPDVKTGNTISREDYQNLAVKGIVDALATSGSIYQADNGNGLNVRGGHGGEVTYFVDGIKVYGSPHLPNQSYPEENKIRKDYADYAYWQPNLITNKNGEVTFNVTFPDNVTKWNSYAIGMDNKKHSGVGRKETKAYKTTMANLAVPRFLIQGDSTLIIGKALNYKSNRVQIKTNFKLNNQIISSRDTLIENSLIEKIPVSCPMKSDSLDLIYSLAMEDGAKDGEQRKIPVFPIGLEETEGVFAVLNNDTNFTVNLDSKVTEVYFQNSPIDFMLEELENLKNYPYWCMEQTASKLSALLMEEKVKNYIHKDFKGERETKKLIGKLEKGQKNNGSWGWWSDSPENLWMTSYILRILGQAKQMGYTVKNVEKAKDFLSWNLGRIKGNELLSALNTLSELKIKLPYAEYIRNLENDSLSLYQKFTLIKIKQENGISHNLKLVLDNKKETFLNGNYWGYENNNWYDNSTNITLLAYKIIAKEDSSNAILQNIRNYFFEIKNQNKWKNTVETASILETLLPAVVRQSNNILKPSSVILSGAMSETISSFPVKRSIQMQEKQLSITKTGSTPVFFTSNQKHWNEFPQTKENLFSINYHYEIDGRKIDSLKAGTEVDLVVTIASKKVAEYVMINVPIPAGCSYDENKFTPNYNEVHREYFKNKTSIFCQQLSQGNHTFKIKLQPRFSGKYTINPIKVELMYFPTFYGNNSMSKVKIN